MVKFLFLYKIYCRGAKCVCVWGGGGGGVNEHLSGQPFYHSLNVEFALFLLSHKRLLNNRKYKISRYPS